MKLFNIILSFATSQDISGCCQRLKLTPAQTRIPQVFQASGSDLFRINYYLKFTISWTFKFSCTIVEVFSWVLNESRKFILTIESRKGTVNNHIHYDMVWPVVHNMDHFYLEFHQGSTSTNRGWMYHTVRHVNAITQGESRQLELQYEIKMGQ